MPEVTAKIINDDGTETSIGPVQVPKTLANVQIRELRPHEDKRQEQLLVARIAEIEAETEQRNRAAEAANKRRESRGQKGLDPDGSDN